MNKDMTIIENNENFIPVYETEKGIKVVSGKDLYKGLKVQQDFSDWIKKQLKNVDAIENVDYHTFWYKVDDPFKKVVEFNGNINSMVRNRNQQDYILKLDIAKEICMVVGVAPRTNQETRVLSKQFRKYFIEVEKRYIESINDTNNINITSLLKEIQELKQDIKTLNDKLDFQNKNLNNERKIINPKEENKNIINEFNYSRFLNHINELSVDAKLTKKEFINLFNSYNFYHKNLGIMELNRLLKADNLIFGNDRITKYAKENKILIRDNYKKHAKVFITKKGMLYLINLLK